MASMPTMLFAERLKYEPAAVMGTMKANVRVRYKKIRLRWIEEYQSENCWDVYASDDTDHAKLLCMARVRTDLGMKTTNLDEMAFGEAAAVALHTTHRADRRKKSLDHAELVD